MGVTLEWMQRDALLRGGGSGGVNGEDVVGGPGAPAGVVGTSASVTLDPIVAAKSGK